MPTPPISVSSNADVIAKRVAAWSGNVNPGVGAGVPGIGNRVGLCGQT